MKNLYVFFRVKFLLVFLLTVTFFMPVFGVYKTSAITYVLNEGRLGDNLFNYCKAKWMSYKYNIPLFYRPFKYSNNLKICEIDNVYKRGLANNFRNTCKFRQMCFRRTHKFDKNREVKINRANSCLYISNCYALIDINWADKNFINEIRKTISPRISIPKHELPKDRISVAVHVRKGGGFDQPMRTDPEANRDPGRNADAQRRSDFADSSFPEKFPPDSFYVEQIKKLYNIVNLPLYVYIFTDDKNPNRIVEKYEKLLTGLDIKFSCRESGNNHDKNVIEDFFTIMQYDCLIRGASNFPFMVDMLGDFFVVISLEDAFWRNNQWVSGEVKVKINNGMAPLLFAR